MNYFCFILKYAYLGVKRLYTAVLLVNPKLWTIVKHLDRNSEDWSLPC